MAKKNLYAVKVGRRTGIFTEWDGPEGAKAQVIGFPGAKYKGFAAKEEALAFLEGAVGGGVGAASGTVSGVAGAFSGAPISREAALANLQKVVIASDVSARIGQLNGAFEDLARHPVSGELVTETEDYRRLSARYGLTLHEGAVFDAHTDREAVAFVDGGGDKSGMKQVSSLIPFGVVLFVRNEANAMLYRYAFSKARDTSFDWIFHASNVSAEVIADLFVMYLCEKLGLSSVTVYQDNNLPAKYFSGEFRKIHNDKDYVLQSYMTESARHLKDGMDIRFVYVPSEHSAKAKSKKKESYEAQEVPKVDFDTAEFYNAVSDILADYRMDVNGGAG